MKWKVERPLRVLDIDLECLPGHWIGSDYVSKIMTAAAMSWMDGKQVRVLTHYDHEPEDMALAVKAEIDKADIVVGHFIRGFDLALLNGNLLMGGHSPLKRVMTHDTKEDLVAFGGRSKSQKNLGAQLGLTHPKVEVTLFEWEQFNQRRKGFKQKGIDRVRGDVLQNKELYARLIEKGWLRGPQMWTDNSRVVYTA